MEMIIEPTVRSFWRVLESPVVTRLIDEPFFDFYAGIFSPRLALRRVLARVESVRDETPSVKSFVLRPNGHFKGFRAGQHVNLTVEIDGVRHTRSYSPSNAPAGRAVVLTVKREPGGLVSSWLHDRLKPGDVVELGQAFGDFTLSRTDPGKLLFIAGGSGITPIASLLRDLSARARMDDVVVLAYGRTYSELIFRDELNALAHRHPGLRAHFAVTREVPATGDLGGRFCSEHIDSIAGDLEERHTFVCGPRTLVRGVQALWTERAVRAPLKTETFAPPDVAPDGADLVSTLRVIAARSARAFSANTAIPLLAQAERAGLSPASGCRQGICFSCTCRKRSGVVRNLTTGAVSSEPDEDIRLCVTAPLSDLTLDL